MAGLLTLWMTLSLLGLFVLTAGAAVLLLERRQRAPRGKLGSTRLLIVGALLSLPMVFSLARTSLPW
jgi:hypothetical protein